MESDVVLSGVKKLKWEGIWKCHCGDLTGAGTNAIRHQSASHPTPGAHKYIAPWVPPLNLLSLRGSE